MLARDIRPRVSHTSRTPDAEIRLWSHEGGRFDAGLAAHATFELAWVESGAVIYRIGDREIVAQAQEAVVVPGGVEHRTVFDGATRAGAIALDRAFMEEMLSTFEADGSAIAPGKPRRASALAALGTLLRAEVCADGPGKLVAIDAMVEAMAIACLRGAAPRTRTRGGRDPRVRAVVDLIHSRYADPIGVDDFAKAAHTSRFHLTRLFREGVGESPYRYLVKTRVERAAELLRAGGRSVTEVALSVGFADMGRFAKAFRRQLGVSPAVFCRSGGGAGLRRPSPLAVR